MHNLYVEPSDEITTVIERLKAAPDELVAIIAPKGATLLQSIVNLKLTRKAAMDADKTIVLVSTDKIGRNLALQLGIPVASTEKEVPAALEGASDAETDETNVIGGVRIHRYYEEEPKSEGPAEFVQPAVIEPIIIPKRITEVAPEVSAVVNPPDVPQLVEEKAAEEAIAEPIAAVAAPVVAQDSEPIARRTINRSAVPPVPEDTSITRTPVNPRTPSPTKPEPKKRRILSYALYCLALLLVAVIATSFLFLPVTNAVVHIQADNWSENQTFTATPETTVISADHQNLPAQVITADATDTVTFTATGSKETGNAAAGTVDLYNLDSTTAQNVPLGTTITASGQTFTTQVAVSVPGFTQPDPQHRIAGHASVSVTANTPGTAGNLSKVAIDPVSLPSGISLSGQITSSGGTTNVITVVSQSDIDTAKAALVKKLTDDATQKMADLIKTTPAAFNAASDTFTADSPTVTPAAGTTAGTGQVQGTAHLKRLAVLLSDIATAAKARALSDATANTQRTFNDPTVGQVTINGSTSTIAITITGKQSAVINLDTIQKALVGKSLSAAQEYIHSTVPNGTLTITQTPRWWPVRSRFPTYGRYTKVTVSYE